MRIAALIPANPAPTANAVHEREHKEHQRHQGLTHSNLQLAMLRIDGIILEVKGRCGDSIRRHILAVNSEGDHDVASLGSKRCWYERGERTIGEQEQEESRDRGAPFCPG